MAPTTSEAPAASAPAAPDVDHVVFMLLLSNKGDWKRIAAESNGLISYSWISKFVNGHIPNAGVSTLKDLRDFLEEWIRVNKPQLPAPPAAAAVGTSSSLPGAASEPPA